ncbi:7252_t:CDS:10, partial [Acaulospora morrowiae]
LNINTQTKKFRKLRDLRIKLVIMSHIAKGTIRQIKNYTKGYSDIQAKVRSATSNDPWGPSGTVMNEIAQATNSHDAFLEIMEIIDKRLNDHGKNWRHVFKALTLLDYCLHMGSQDVVTYAKKNIYVVKTLREFQYIDDDGKDQGANVRQKAKEITNLLLDDDRLNNERRQRNDMRNRMMGRSDTYPGTIDRSLSSTPTYDNSIFPEEEDADMKRAMEESLRTLKNEADKKNKPPSNQFSQQTDLFGNPISSANPQYGVPYIGTPNTINLIDQQQSNFNNQSQYLNHASPFGSLATSNLSSPNLSTVPTIDSVFNPSNKQPVKPQDEKHPELASLIGNRGNGMDTFGNVGDLRVPTGSGFANSGSLTVQPPRRSNSVGNLSDSANQVNPFLSTGNIGTYNTLPSTFGTQTARSTNDLFSTSNTFSSSVVPSTSSFSTTSYTTTSNSLIDLDGGGFSSQLSKNPFQTVPSTNTISNINKPKSLNDLGRENQYAQSQTLNMFGQPTQGSNGGFLL